MKHVWQDVRGKTQVEQMYETRRRCQNCGAEQTFEKDQLWMRIVRRYWYPKVGRCKPVTPAPRKRGR